jgi:hypothetical protein
MKTKIVITSFFLAVFVIFFSACEPVSKSNKNLAYKSSEILTRNIINQYFYANQSMNFSSSFQQDLAEILAGTDYDSTSFENINLISFFDEKINIFSEYFDLMLYLQKEEGIEQATIQIKIISLMNTIDSCNGIVDIEKTQKIRDYVSAVQFNEDQAILECSDIIIDIWAKDITNWITILNTSYNKYALTIDQIPTSVFDEVKLEKYVYEPYTGKETLVKVYKLKMKQEMYELKTKFIDKSTRLMSISNELKSVFAEFANSKSNSEYTNYANERIYNSIKAYESNL